MNKFAALALLFALLVAFSAVVSVDAAFSRKQQLALALLEELLGAARRPRGLGVC